MDDIIWLGQGDCHDCTLVGGKGANLCHLIAGHRIPPAFCLTAVAFSRWSAEVDPERAALPLFNIPLTTTCSKAYTM